MQFREIAAALGITTNQAQSDYRRALRKLAQSQELAAMLALHAMRQELHRPLPRINRRFVSTCAPCAASVLRECL